MRSEQLSLARITQSGMYSPGLLFLLVEEQPVVSIWMIFFFHIGWQDTFDMSLFFSLSDDLHDIT